MPPTILSSNFKLSFFSRNKNIKKEPKKFFWPFYWTWRNAKDIELKLCDKKVLKPRQAKKCFKIAKKKSPKVAKKLDKNCLNSTVLKKRNNPKIFLNRKISFTVKAFELNAT
jgi:hypothetical protein